MSNSKSKSTKFDRDWGWKFDSNLDVNGLTFAVERAAKAGATRREIELRLMRKRKAERRSVSVE